MQRWARSSAFGSSDNLAGAYGIAVSLLMAITTLLAAPVAIQWGFNPVLVIAVNGLFLLIDLIFVAANSMKLFQGGWFPMLLAAAIAFLMLTWRRGQQIAEKARSRLRESEEEFVANLLARPPVRLPGTAAFLTSGTAGIPLTLTLHLKHIYALHERVLLVTVLTSEEPRVREDERAEIQDLPAGLSRVILHYGFMETPSVPEGRSSCARAGTAQLWEPVQNLVLHRQGNDYSDRAHSGHVVGLIGKHHLSEQNHRR